MAERLDASTTAVLAVHLQKHMVHADSPVAQMAGFGAMVEKTSLFDHVNAVLSAARKARAFVAYVGSDMSGAEEAGYRYPVRGDFCRMVAGEHAGGEVLRPGHWGFDIHEAVAMQPGDAFIANRQLSAFSGSDLDARLRARGIADIVVMGVATGFAVSGTVWSAIDRGYSVILLEDCCTAGSEEAHEAAMTCLRPIADVWKSADFVAAIG
jgi:nicotinamidase-related amidase